MAVTKQMHMKEAKKGAKSSHLKNAIAYILKPEKTGNGLYAGAVNCIPKADPAYRMMMQTKDQWGKPSGRQGYHYVLSFAPGEASPETAYEIMERFTKEYLGGRYEAVFAVHTDTDIVHGHLVFNSVSCMDGYKYHAPKGEWQHRIQPAANRLCEEYGLSTIEVSRDGKEQSVKDPAYGRKGSGYGSHTACQSAMLRRDIDECIGKSTDFEEFLAEMQQRGFAVDMSRKHPTLRHEGMERNRRFETLGKDYSLERIRERIAAGERPVPEPGIRETVPGNPSGSAWLETFRLEMHARIRISGEAYSRVFRQTKATAAMREFYRLRDIYEFLAKNGIHSRHDLDRLVEQGREEVKQLKKSVREAREGKAEDPRQAEVNRLAESWLAVRDAGEAYRMGEEEFYPQYREMRRFEDRLAAYGQEPEEAVKALLAERTLQEQTLQRIKELQGTIRKAEDIRRMAEEWNRKETGYIPEREAEEQKQGPDGKTERKAERSGRR